MRPIEPAVLALLIKGLPGIPSELELYEFARAVELLHGIGTDDTPALTPAGPPRFI